MKTCTELEQEARAIIDRAHRLGHTVRFCSIGGPLSSSKSTLIELTMGFLDVFGAKETIVPISMSTEIRDAMKGQDDLGIAIKAAQSLMNSGGLLQDEQTIQVMLQAAIREMHRALMKPQTSRLITLILDGYPRTKQQLDVLTGLSVALTCALVEIPQHIAEQRAISRLTQLGRADDNPESRVMRWYNWRHHTLPTMESMLLKWGSGVQIDGTIPITNRIEMILQLLLTDTEELGRALSTLREPHHPAGERIREFEKSFPAEKLSQRLMSLPTDAQTVMTY